VDNNRGTILGSRRPVVLRARRLSATPRRWPSRQQVTPRRRLRPLVHPLAL